MLALLRLRDFRRLFTAHVASLLGTGLATVAIGLLAFDIAGGDAAAVLGTILAIKMGSYLLLGPLAPVVASRLGQKRLLVATDLLRAGVALALPFTGNLGAAYLLIFTLQAASALFTPTFQAAIPLVVRDEDQYTRALALSRLAYDVESLISPMLAGLLLLALPSQMLFVGTGIGFLGSGLLILSVALPRITPPAERAPIRQQLTRGTRLMLEVPALRGLLALHLAVAAVGSIVMVLSIPIARGELGGTESQASLLLAAFGLGSIASAILMPRILRYVSVRTYQLSGVAVLASGMALLWPVLAIAADTPALLAVAALWFISGLGYSATLTPMGRVIRTELSDRDLPDAFAAQFSLAHGWWLLCYPLAGWGSTLLGTGPASLILVGIGAASLLFAAKTWPSDSLSAEKPVGAIGGSHG